MSWSIRMQSMGQRGRQVKNATIGEADRLLQEVLAAGGRIVKPAGRTDWGGYARYFADPDGFLWEVAWNPRFPHG